MEEEKASLLGMDGFGRARDHQKSVVHGIRSLECVAVRPQSGHGESNARARPKTEWITHQDEDVRIVSDELFQRAQTRTRRSTNNDERLKSGGKAKYLLSGVLVCKVCGANYVIADARSYVCSGHWNGGACSNRIRVRRDSIERTLLDPIRTELQSPDRCKQMAKEMHAAYAERLKANAQRVETMPQESAALDARLERLRERLKKGDLDMTPDELQATIERVEAKRRELTNAATRSAAGDGAKIISLLPPKPPNTMANKSHWDSTVTRKRQRKPAPSCANFSVERWS